MTTTLPLKTCRICVIVPVRNEAEHLPNTLGALAQQVDSQGRPLNPDSYEVLVCQQLQRWFSRDRRCSRQSLSCTPSSCFRGDAACRSGDRGRSASSGDE
ncbi:MAG: hypothetical protein HC886_23690 [Leptolyngbyaceae cyanobacterium SM1_1_3]|nr:hypothetical protein [Leptolyngbyaceae cyanobacterium SM1_1_3]